MNKKMLLLACLGLTGQMAAAGEQAPPPHPEWLTDEHGCKFLNPMPRGMLPVTIQWNGACVDGFVSGPGELRVFTVIHRGEFAKGLMVKGTAETNGLVIDSAFVDNHPHGEGEMRMPDGTVMKVKFNRGNIDGTHAEITWPEGSRYRGGIDPQSRKPHGKGVVELSDGAKYEGGFKYGSFEGPGVLKRADGETLTGTFVAGELHGKGSVEVANGSRYEGELRFSEGHGLGRMELADGTVYEGSFVSGQFHGKGKLKYADDAVYEGEFLVGQPSGTGTLTLVEGSRYVGQFLNGKRNGAGRFTHASGDIEEGEWKGGVLSGKCRITRQERIYDGECRDGKANGFGRLADKASNLQYEGGFLNDEFDGKGSLHVGEMSYEGTFKSGVMQGAGVLSVGKVTMRGEFKGGVLARGTIAENEGRTFEIDVDKDEVLEVQKDGTKRPIDELPPEITI